MCGTDHELVGKLEIEEEKCHFGRGTGCSSDGEMGMRFMLGV